MKGGGRHKIKPFTGDLRMGSISADQHNMTRRAAKQRRKKASKLSRPVEEASPLAMAVRERTAKEKYERISFANGQRLLTKLRQSGSLCLKCKDESIFGDGSAMRQYEHDKRDIKKAIKDLQHSERRLYVWNEDFGDEDGVGFSRFVVGIRRR